MGSIPVQTAIYKPLIINGLYFYKSPYFLTGSNPSNLILNNIKYLKNEVSFLKEIINFKNINLLYLIK